MEDSAGKITELNERQRSGMDAARLLAEMGLDVTVYASTEADRKAGMENGNIRLSDGSILVDLNAGADGQGVMAFALSHEFTHFVEEMSPKKFRAFTDILFEEMGKNGTDVSALIEAKAQKLGKMEDYKGLSENELNDLAYSEVTAEMMETALTDTDVMERISARLQQTDKSLWGKIKDFLKGLVDRLKAAYKGLNPDSGIAQLARETINSSEKVLDAFADAASDAVVNYRLQDGQKNNATEGVQFSQREYDSISKQFSDEISQWVKDGQDGDRQFILGSTGEVLQGLGAIESDIYMNSDKINTILDEHPEITLEEIRQIPKIINDPILILKSRNAGRSAQNTRMTMFSSVKGQNGLPVMVVFDLRPSENHFVISDMQKVTSAYTKTTEATSFVENSFIMYADEKRTTSLLRSIGFHMPIELLQSGYIGSISYNRRSVNIYGEKFSDVFRKDNLLYSSRQRAEGKAEQLATEVEYLKKLVQIQKKGNSDYTLDRTSLKQFASQLIRENGASGSSTELAALLEDTYNYISRSTDFLWEGIEERAGKAVDWLEAHRKVQRDSYAQEVLDFMSKRHVKLSEAQLGEKPLCGRRSSHSGIVFVGAYFVPVSATPFTYRV